SLGNALLDPDLAVMHVLHPRGVGLRHSLELRHSCAPYNAARGPTGPLAPLCVLRLLFWCFECRESQVDRFEKPVDLRLGVQVEVPDRSSNRVCDRVINPVREHVPDRCYEKVLSPLEDSLLKIRHDMTPSASAGVD